MDVGENKFTKISDLFCIFSGVSSGFGHWIKLGINLNHHAYNDEFIPGFCHSSFDWLS